MGLQKIYYRDQPVDQPDPKQKIPVPFLYGDTLDRLDLGFKASATLSVFSGNYQNGIHKTSKTNTIIIIASTTPPQSV